MINLGIFPKILCESGPWCVSSLVHYTSPTGREITGTPSDFRWPWRRRQRNTRGITGLAIQRRRRLHGQEITPKGLSIRLAALLVVQQQHAARLGLK